MKIAESVTPGHPDKICDQIADAILDQYLKGDPKTQALIKVLGDNEKIIIRGEVSSSATVDHQRIVGNVLADIGAEAEIPIDVKIRKRPITSERDIVTVHGYSTNETNERLPKVLVFAYQLTRKLDELRKDLPWLGADGKAQIAMEEGNIRSVVIDCQYLNPIDEEKARSLLKERLCDPIIGNLKGSKLYFNPAGPFNLGGFKRRAGASGSQLAVDTYGGLAPGGNLALSGKDPSALERCGAYMARFAANSLVGNGYTDKCLITAVYPGKRSKPSILLVTDGEGHDLSGLLKELDFRPEAIIEKFDLKKPIYRQTACFGHFGRDTLPWERIEVI